MTLTWMIVKKWGFRMQKNSGNMVQNVLKKSKLSISELSAETGVTYKTIMDWKAGRSKINKIALNLWKCRGWL